MSKKKILIFIDWYLPGYKAGGPIQSVANLVAHLNAEYDFSIVTRDTDYCETKPYTQIKSNQWNDLSEGTRVYYFSENELSYKNVKQLLNNEEYDEVYLNGIFSSYFTLLPLYVLKKKKEKRVVIAARGMFAPSALNVKKTKKQLFLKIAKLFGMFNNVKFHATTENEKQEIIKVLSAKTTIKIAGNLPQKIEIDSLPVRTKTNDVARLINVARVAPEKNLLFALEVLRQVKSNIDFDFYGPIYNEEYWKQCQQAMELLPTNVQATYKGSIEPEKVLEQLRNYHFMFMPTRGENFGHIILQSLSAACPVIISDQTPWKDLKEKNVGWDLSLQQPESFARLIDECALMEQKEYDLLSKSAFEFGKTYSSNPLLIKQNKELFSG